MNSRSTLTAMFGFLLLGSYAVGQTGVLCLFQAPPVTYDLPPFGPVSVATGDFNGDGDTDFVFAMGVEELAVFLNNGDGTFAEPSFVFSALFNSIVRAVDMDNDTDLDLVVGGESGIDVLLNQGDATFLRDSYQTNSDFEIVNALDVGDFDDDGNIDIAVGNPGATIDILTNMGDGTFSISKTNLSGGNVRTGDLNGDGMVDLVYRSADVIEVAINNGSGEFNQTTAIATSNSFVSGMAVASLFGTPSEQIVATARFPDELHIVEYDNMLEALAIVDTLPIGASSSLPVIADIDMDGQNDVAFPNGNFPDGSITMMLNQGNGTLGNGSNLVQNFVNSFAFADFNGDGRNDLVVGSGDGNPNQASVFFQNPLTLGDANLDGQVNLLDVDTFVLRIAFGSVLKYSCESDINLDGSIDLLDVDPFVALLNGS